MRDGSAPLYLFDVRSPEEYAAGHLPGSISRARRPARAGDRHLRRRARRAHRAGGRPRRARHHDRLLAAADGLGGGLRRRRTRYLIREEGPAPGTVPTRTLVSAKELKAWRPGSRFRHQPAVPGRPHPGRRLRDPRAPGESPELPCDRAVACTSPDGLLARFAAADLSALLKRDVPRWKAARRPGAPPDCRWRPARRACSNRPRTSTTSPTTTSRRSRRRCRITCSGRSRCWSRSAATRIADSGIFPRASSPAPVESRAFSSGRIFRA